jgi:hypothetical protein
VKLSSGIFSSSMTSCVRTEAENAEKKAVKTLQPDESPDAELAVPCLPCTPRGGDFYALVLMDASLTQRTPWRVDGGRATNFARRRRF